MKQPELIYHGEKAIVYLNFSGVKTKEEILSKLESFGKYIQSQPLNSLITLTNLDGMYFNTEIFNAFTNYVKKNNPHVKESAVIGMKGLMQIFYKGFVKVTGRNVIVCNTKEEAINQLVSNNLAAV